jgi:hypothetical protein
MRWYAYSAMGKVSFGSSEKASLHSDSAFVPDREIHHQLTCDAALTGGWSRQLGTWKINSMNKRRASSSGLGPVTALDLLWPSKNTDRTPWWSSYSPVYFLFLMSIDIGERAGILHLTPNKHYFLCMVARP